MTIATLEHVIAPYESMTKALDLLKIGGIAYFQAGPLYFSKTGHHMFKELESIPWGHLQYTTEQLASHLPKEIKVGIEKDHDRVAIDFIEQMLSMDHLNHLTFKQYRLNEILQMHGFEVLFFEVSREGTKKEIPTSLLESGLDPEDLLIHGFELIVKRSE